MKFFAGGVACLLAGQYLTWAGYAQEPVPVGFNLVVVEGEGSTNNYSQHIRHEPVVRVEDDKSQPIAGASVVFTLPTEGTTGVFANGAKTFITATDNKGIATGKGFRPNQVSGKMVIHVSASFRGLTARTVINQVNEGTPGVTSAGGGHGGRTALIIAVIAAAAGGGAYFATHKSGSSSSPSTTLTSPVGIGLTPGTGAIIGPH